MQIRTLSFSLAGLKLISERDPSGFAYVGRKGADGDTFAFALFSFREIRV